MQKFAFIATNEWVRWGGSEYCWAAAAERLALRGAEVSVSVKEWDGPVKQVDQLRAAGCRILYRPKRTLLRRACRKVLLRHEYDWAEARKIGTGADLIIISVGATREGLTWFEAAKSLHFPYAIIMQAAGPELWPPDELAAQLRSCYESACAAYFVSEANLALIRRQFATPLERGRVIRNPFNVRYDARPAWPGDPTDQLLLACVARLEIVQKAQDVLIDVLSLPHWRSRNIRVALVGSGKNDYTIRQMLQTAQLTNVELVGFVEDIEELWSRYHALVLPSRFEGMPLALVEAMLCGRACIVTDVSGNTELVRDGENGFLAKAPTIELLDEAMNRAWENRQRLREMGERAAIDVRQWVSPDPTEEFVHELIALASGARSMETIPIGQCQPSPR